MSVDPSDHGVCAHARPGQRLPITIKIRRYLNITPSLRRLQILGNGDELLERDLLNLTAQSEEDQRWPRMPKSNTGVCPRCDSTNAKCRTKIILERAIECPVFSLIIFVVMELGWTNGDGCGHPGRCLESRGSHRILTRVIFSSRER